MMMMMMTMMIGYLEHSQVRASYKLR